MPYAIDAEIATAMKELVPKMGSVDVPARGDWKALRDAGNAKASLLATRSPSYPDVRSQPFSTTSKDGAKIALRWYSKIGVSPGSAVVYVHGGGMILATLDHYDSVVSNYVTATGVPFLSVDYRLAPESQGEALAEDAFAGVVWLRAHATKLGVALDRIAIMGDSAGGGIAAGAAILARDRAIELSKQILIYPMLDDRNVEPITTLESLLTWTYDDNYTGWSAMLGSDFVTERVSPIAAPARLQDFKALPPVYIEVGELDIFREEDIRYALHLMNAGVPTELHVHPGAPHGFDRIAPTAELTRRAFNDRSRVIQSI